jgi:DNA polymerase delta subunit 1
MAGASGGAAKRQRVGGGGIAPSGGGGGGSEDGDIDDVDVEMMLAAEADGDEDLGPQPDDDEAAAAAAAGGGMLADGAMEEAWRRPAVAGGVQAGAGTVPLSLMQMDVSENVVMGAAKPVIRVFGVTERGESVLVRVHGFQHYFYVPAGPAVLHASPDAFRAGLEARLRSVSKVKCPVNVVAVEVVRKRSIFYYIPGDPELPFFKVTVANPKVVREAARELEQGNVVVDGAALPEVQTFDASLEYVLRFMIEVGLVGCSWLTLPPGKYVVAPPTPVLSHAQMVVDVAADDVIAHKPEGAWLKTAALRRLSFDIECQGRKGVFPEPEHDPVIQIANYVWDHGAEAASSKVVFTLKSCASIVGADVVSFEGEGEMLSAWSRFVRLADPDVLTGYNIVNFDLPYLIDRARKLGVADFAYLGRLAGQETVMRSTKMSSSAFGTHESKSFTMHGRVVMDMLQIVTRDHKLRSYSLNSVSAEFLGEQKEDVHYSIISDLQRGNDQTRRRLAVYCLKDALLPVRLMDKLMCLTNYMEMARVTGIPLGWLVSRGHMIKVVSLLHKKSHEVDLVIPDIKGGKAGGKSGGDGGPQFEGATVIEPKRGYYTDPIATLDFASLYPSIIMAHNLCYSTLVKPEHLRLVPPEHVSKTPTGASFVKESVKQGTLTNILLELLGARKKAKRDLAAATDPFLKSVLNGRQLALKISANAVYGFTGATVGKLPCMDISASTTAYGRDMIEFTRAEVEKRYPGSDVIYGDTDSVMIKFGAGKTLDECMKLGEAAARVISEQFPKPVKLEFEKCYYPYLLVSKKRYAGLLWTETDKFDKMDCKGIEAVRRDNCRLVANVISSVLDLLLVKQQLQEAIGLVKRTIADLLQNKIDVSLLVVSKALTKTEENYENKQAHVALAEKLRKRDPGTAPSLGDRVPYVIITGRKNEPAYSRAEDPLYVLEHNVPIDNHYYLENMLRKPLERIFEPVMKSGVNSLFVGDHTRAVAVVTPRSGGMMKFAAVGLSCLGCKSQISSGALCKFCTDREPEVYLKHMSLHQGLERNYAALWTECQRCMGDLCQDVLCSNGDCPIFYRRRKAQKDLDAASARLERFEVDW